MGKGGAGRSRKAAGKASACPGEASPQGVRPHRVKQSGGFRNVLICAMCDGNSGDRQPTAKQRISEPAFEGPNSKDICASQ